MSSLLVALAFCLAAHAGPTEDLALAADSDVPVVARQQAFDRLVALGSTDMALVTRVAQDVAGDTRQRWVAIRALGHIGGAGALQVVQDLLADPQPAIRAAAVGALGESGRPDLTASVAAMLTDPAIIVRAEAAVALGKLGDDEAVQPLAEALEDRSNWHRGTPLWVRRHYVVALGDIGHKAAVPALLRALDDPDPLVSAEVVPAFEKIGGFSMGEGRTPEQEVEAWRRWASAQVQ